MDDALIKDINNEDQVVYILSRIRKYLELKNIKSKYKYLNFYCNWALHSKIDRTERIAGVLREVIEGSDGGHFWKFIQLEEDLRKFLKDYDLHQKIIDDDKNYLRFINLLVNIYSDTPVEVALKKKRTITIKKPEEELTDGNSKVPCEVK